MLFKLANNTPRFEVFQKLNDEFLYFLEQASTASAFVQSLFSNTNIGKACWDNAKVNSKTQNDLTRDKFEKLFTALQNAGGHTKKQLFETVRDNQNLQCFFENPPKDLLAFLPTQCFDALKDLTNYLYCRTKALSEIIHSCGGININNHFSEFKKIDVNGNICKACGMRELSATRANIAEEKQWRADYDHQLCQSKYPIFAVHPDNLIPLCDTCNQDAKGAKDLFCDSEGNGRLAFYPYEEEARCLVDVEIDNLRDPEPTIKVIWATKEPSEIKKLETWDNVYQICNRVEGKLRSVTELILDEINPEDLAHFDRSLGDKCNPIDDGTLKRKEWAFWQHKFFCSLRNIDSAPFYEACKLKKQQGEEGANYILSRS